MARLPCRLLPALVALLFAAASHAEPHAGPHAGPLDMGVRGHRVGYGLFSLFAAPGETLRLDVAEAGAVRLLHEGDVFGRAGTDHWRFEAPAEPGLYPLRLVDTGGQRETRINLFVGHVLPPGQESLNGYRIGPSPPGHRMWPELYAAPRYFIEVTEDLLHTRLTPHFTLAQFLCKQVADFPRYVVITEGLLVLLERLLQVVRDEGFPVQTFGIISAYRTPWYNRRIGNVPNSRHVYGDAMDLFIDLDEDGRLDDLNGDGEHDRADVDYLYRIVEKFRASPGNALLVGGVGRYYANARHGGFVHVDARGFRARW